MKLIDLHVADEYVLQDDDHREPTKVRVLSAEPAGGWAVQPANLHKLIKPHTFPCTNDIKEEDWLVMVEVVASREQIPVRCGDLRPGTATRNP